jgi:uncharacterized protein (DUF1800 family)
MTQQGWWIWQFLIILTGVLCPTVGLAQSIDPQVIHVVNRLSFGARPGDYEQVQAIGVDRYIQAQLNPSENASQIPEPSDRQAQLASQPNRSTDAGTMVQLFRAPNDPANPNAKNHALQQVGRDNLKDATAARLWRAIASPRQLEEVMVDFWFNHFNVHSGKGRTKIWVNSYEQTAIRPHALGKFRDLLGATARHPAMLYYLDNWQNTAKGINENYARELMELHTLGVDGGYSQADVTTLAKVFTGWGLAAYNSEQPMSNDPTSGFSFSAKRHDATPKQFLDKPLKQTGEAEGEEVLDILATHPSTAKFISFKLAQYFVSDRPPQSLVDRLQKQFLATDGDIRQVLQTLFASPEFRNPKIYQQKYKTPYQYVISAVRATGETPLNPVPLSTTLQQLSMPIYGCPTPDGYPQVAANWLNPDSTVRRLSFAVNLGNGTIGIAIPANRKMPIAPVPIANLTQTIGPLLQSSTRERIQSQPANLRTGLMLGSPEFMYR